MPFKSKAQRNFLFAKHPKIAEEFEDKTPKGASLPEHVKPHKPMGDHERLADMVKMLSGSKGGEMGDKEPPAVQTMAEEATEPSDEMALEEGDPSMEEEEGHKGKLFGHPQKVHIMIHVKGHK